MYRHHTGYIGNMKEIPYKRMLDEKPEEIIISSVRGMLPKSKLRAPMLKRLRVYAGNEHPHTAQKPETL